MNSIGHRQTSREKAHIKSRVMVYPSPSGGSSASRGFSSCFVQSANHREGGKKTVDRRGRPGASAYSVGASRRSVRAFPRRLH